MDMIKPMSRKDLVDELFPLLREEAERIKQDSAGALSIAVHFLDLWLRLKEKRSLSLQDNG